MLNQGKLLQTFLNLIEMEIRILIWPYFNRTNAQSRVLETCLLKEGIPYSIVGSVEFFKRKEIKDILSYLKLSSNPDDDLSLERIVNVSTERHRADDYKTFKRMGGTE